MRADSAGATKEFLAGCRKRNVTFSVVREIEQADHKGDRRHLLREEAAGSLHGARTASCARERPSPRSPTWSTSPGSLPAPAVIAAEPLHPGAQQTLFHCPTYRFWGHYTDEKGTPVKRDLYMRVHAHVEDHIERLKNAGLLRMPFRSLEANKTWFALVCFGADLVRWFQLLLTDGSLRAAEPKTLSWYLWHVPARLVYAGRRVLVRILDGCPAADDLLEAYRRIAMLT